MPPDHDNPVLRLVSDPDDRSAWAAAVSAYGGLCWRIALRMLDDEHAATDAVQDCLLAIRGSARRFSPGSDADAAAKAWVAKIAVNTCHEHRRRRRFAQSLPSDLAAPAPTTDAEELAPAIREALAALPRGQGEAVSLRYLAGLEYDQVALALGIDPTAARMRVSRGLGALRLILERRGVTVSMAVLAAVVDASAAEPVIPPPPAATMGWSSAPLPSLSTISIATVITMSILLIAGISITTAMAVIAADAPAPVVPDVAPVPVVDQLHAASLQPLVKQQLAWLVQQQLPDGSWPEQARESQPNTAVRRPVSVTARALLCFLRAGYHHRKDSEFKDTVARGLAWLEVHEDTDGDVVAAALRVMVIAELYTMTNDHRLRPVTSIAMHDLLVARVGAGWPEKRGGENLDTLATTYAVMAMKSYQTGDAADAFVAECQADAKQWLREIWIRHETTGFPHATSRSGALIGSETADAAAAVCASCLGFRKSDAKIAGLLRRATALPARGLTSESRYFATFNAFMAGGETWTNLLQQREFLIEESGPAQQQGQVADVASLTLGMEVYTLYELVWGPTRNRITMHMPPGTEFPAEPAQVEY